MVLFATGLHPRLFRLNPFRIFSLKPRKWFDLNNPVRSAGKENKAEKEPRSGFNKALIINMNYYHTVFNS